jgi:hypothetical protein
MSRNRRSFAKAATPGLKPGYTTYAVFSVPSEDIPGGGVRLVPVAARDLSQLSLPDDSWRFYFCAAPDAETAVNNDPLRDEEDLSPYYLIADEILDADELRRRLIAQGVLQDPPPPPGRRDRDGLLRRDDLAHFIWTVKLAQAPFHAISPQGHATPIAPGHRYTVIDREKRILMGPEDASPRPPPAQATPPYYPRPRDRRYKL